MDPNESINLTESESKTLPYVTLAEGTIASDFALKNLNKALGEAQNEFGDAVKSATNTYGGWQYTPLKAIIAAARPSLTKFHLTVSQFPLIDLESKTITLYTRLVHWDSGEWMQNALDLPGELALGKDGAPKFNQQTIGGSLTYGMKYAYKPIIGIPDGEEMIDSTEEKGDLPARSKSQSRQTQRQSSPPQQPSQQPPPQTPPPAQEQGLWKPMPGDILNCVIKGVKELETKPGEKGTTRKYAEVIWNGYLNSFNHASAWDTGLFDALKAGVGKEVQLKLKPFKAGDKFLNIADVFYVDGVEYKDGLPLVDRETGEILEPEGGAQ